ncbi:carbohydrate ABC transporter permease [Breznakiella homolactica]|uniref:Sugar ABC transporter permease n=1 Tax=Breznakiella homolactica TaxID=2798577 RepID=A0A7T7XLH2_9SPIR|nr:sugar ABC transporter permease [Breznakiella homolactica]QQO08604.1 sugar ABC transporter permease [Breznakiella homolactica]
MARKALRSPLSPGLKSNVLAWALLAPALVFLLLFTIFPIFRSFYLGLTEYALGMREPEFIGFKNYIDFAKSPLFWKIMGNTLYFSVLTVIPSMVIGLGLAMLVNRKIKGVGFLRTAFFYPVVMPMIAIASIWLFIYMANTGMLDQFLVKIGLKPLDVLSNRNTVLPSMSVMYVWKEAGYLMIFFLSGLQNINVEMYEAATIDGARPWTVFRKITLPLLGPTLLFVSTIAITNSIKLVDHIVIMTEGAPNNASTLLLYYIYQQGFIFFDQAKASALTVIMLVIMLFVSMLQFLKTDSRIHYN